MRSLLLPLALSLAPAIASAELTGFMCDDTDRVKKQLSDVMGAEKHSWGLRGPDTVMEISIAPAGSWTMVQSYANGTSCVVAMGEHWESAES